MLWLRYLLFQAKVLFNVSPECFIPKPKVDSSVLQLIPKGTTLDNEDEFFAFVKKSFNLRRKILITHLKKNETKIFEGLSLEDLIYLEGLRAENLSPQQYLNLFYRGFISQ